VIIDIDNREMAPNVREMVEELVRQQTSLLGVPPEIIFCRRTLSWHYVWWTS